MKSNATAEPSLLDHERFLPAEMQGAIALEHWHRYVFASQFTDGKVVLDLACGDGYGSDHLALNATHVYGIDISQPTIVRAREQYRRQNLEFLTGACAAIPLAPKSIDVVVSFETIEHHNAHDAMMAEFKRVLRPGGLLIISSPNKAEYSDRASYHNPFHVRELYQHEFKALLTKYFRNVRLVGQRLVLGSLLVPERNSFDAPEHFTMRDRERPAADGMDPIYSVALASDRKLPATKVGILDNPLLLGRASASLGRNKTLADFLLSVAAPESAVLRASLHSEWYKRNNADVFANGVDPVSHWLKLGAGEGRLPANDLGALFEQLITERTEIQHSRLHEALKAGREAERELVNALREKEDDHRRQLETLRAEAERARTFDRQTNQELVEAQAAAAQHREDAWTTRLRETTEQVQKLESLVKCLRQQEEHARRQLDAVQADAERIRQLDRQLAEQRLETATKGFAREETQLRDQAAALASELESTRKRTDEISTQLRREIAKLRIRSRYEVEAVLRSAANEKEHNHRQLDHLRAEAQREKEQTHRRLDHSRAEAQQRLLEQEATFLKALEERDQRFQQQKELDRQLHQEQIGAHVDALSAERQVALRLENELNAVRSREHNLSEQLRIATEQFNQHGVALSNALREREQSIRSELDAARAQAEHTRILDQQEAERRLRAQAKGFSIVEGELNATTQRLSRRLAEIERTWLWRLRLLFFPAEPILSGFTSDEQDPLGESLSHSEHPPRDLSELLVRNDDDFVEQAYAVLLGRAADEGGHAHYVERLHCGASKLDIVWALRTSPEGRAYRCSLEGLDTAMKRLRWRRLPFIGRLLRIQDAYDALADSQKTLRLKLHEAHANLSDLQDKYARCSTELGRFIEFDPKQYLAVNQDVATANINPYEHYVRFGHTENRLTRHAREPSSAALECDWLATSSERAQPTRIPSRATDIIVPIFNGYEFLGPLFESVIANTTLSYRLILVNDCSSDERVAGLLDAYSERIPGTLLLTNESNRGFIGSVNRAIESVRSDFFVLLNSDTEVPTGWLERLIRPLELDERVATVTPFSNAATICSFPVSTEDNALYLGLSLAQIDRAFSSIGTSTPAINIPTGVGFCMAMRTNVVEQIGGFDPAYGRGYGEENDWCMRASALGYRHVLAVNLFVYHKHGGSFPTEERIQLIKRNLGTLSSRYPNYHDSIRAHILSDPARPIREFVKLLLICETSGGATLVVDHDLGGGANSFRRRLLEDATTTGRPALLLIHDPREPQRLSLIAHTMDGEKRFSLPSTEALVEFLGAIPIHEVVYNNLVGSAEPLRIIRILGDQIQALSVPLTVMIHDFYPICPSYTLINKAGKYCGVPKDLETCAACIGEIPKDLMFQPPDELDIKEWRTAWRDFLNLAKEVRCFSDSSKEIVLRAFPELAAKCSVVPHSIHFEPRRLPNIRGNESLRIGVVGGINYQKGRPVLEELVRYIERRRLPHKVFVIGEMDLPVNGITVTGRYQVDSLPEILEELGINVILIPSIWPETFSYVTSEMMILGMPIACFDLGAPAERIRNYQKGRVLGGFDPENILSGLLEICPIAPPDHAWTWSRTGS